MNDAQTTSPDEGDNPQEDVFSGACVADADAALVLDSGQVFWGYGAGASCEAVGEVCFNTSMTGYQEILTDPSYAGQLITFTFPHIGNTGTNEIDNESDSPTAKGIILKANITKPSNFRSDSDLNSWLIKKRIIGIQGIDTRSITSLIRKNGMELVW